MRPETLMYSSEWEKGVGNYSLRPYQYEQRAVKASLGLNTIKPSACVMFRGVVAKRG